MTDICARITGVDSRVSDSRFSGCANDDVGGLRVTGVNAIVEDNRVRGSANGCITVSGTDTVIDGNRVSNCDTNYGIQVTGANAAITDNRVRASQGDGFELAGPEQRIIGNQVTNSKDHCFDMAVDDAVVKKNVARTCELTGFFAHGDNPKISRNTASDTFNVAFLVECTGGALECDEGFLRKNVATGANQAASGFVVNDAFEPFEVTGNTAKTNSGNGFDLEVSSAEISGNTASSNGSQFALVGLRVRGDGNTVTDNRSIGNAGDGISVEGELTVIEQNVANENGADGIDIVSPFADNELTENTALDNGAEGFDNGGDQTDARRNDASGNIIDCATDTSNLGTIDVNQGNDCGDGSDFEVQSSFID